MSRESKKIAKLNDVFRTTFIGGTLILTEGVQAGGEAFCSKAREGVETFETFTKDNDPYGEHDFGAFVVDDQKLFWKIDYYDKECVYGSNDPANPEVTTRVLTIMLAEEY